MALNPASHAWNCHPARGCRNELRADVAMEQLAMRPLSIKDALFFMIGVALMVGALYFTHNHTPPIDIEIVEAP